MFKGLGENLLGFGCLWAVLMFVAFILGVAFQGLTGRKEDLSFLYTLAIPLAVALAVALAILSPRAECGMRIPMYSRICPYCRTRRS